MTHRRHIPAAAAAMLCLTAPAVVAGQVISGRVVIDPARTPAAHAVVVLVGDSSRIVGRTRTDSGGVFIVDAPKPGRFWLAFFSGAGSSASVPIQLDSAAYVEREFLMPPVPAATGEIFLAGEVTRQAMAKPRNRLPTMPHSGTQGIRGLVRVAFVVSDRGEPETKTLQVIGATGPAVASAVRDGLGRLRYFPAERDGQAVRQLVELTFDFGCHDDPPTGDIVIRMLALTCRGE